MDKTLEERSRNKWLSVPIIAMITRLLCRELTLQNEYLRAENKILKSKINKQISFTDEERRTLVDAALAIFIKSCIFTSFTSLINEVLYHCRNLCQQPRPPLSEL